MPQGTWLGPLIFRGTWLGPLIFGLLIDDLSTGCVLHKFVDDSTLTEIFERGKPSAISDHLNNVIERSRDNLMNVNYKKTKEMLFGVVNGNEIGQLIVDGNSIARVSTFKLLGIQVEIGQLIVDGDTIARVSSFKLLGIQVESNLKWNSHVEYTFMPRPLLECIFFKQLKKCSNNIGDMLHFYTTVIRPVLEYACPVCTQVLRMNNVIVLHSFLIRVYPS